MFFLKHEASEREKALKAPENEHGTLKKDGGIFLVSEDVSFSIFGAGFSGSSHFNHEKKHLYAISLYGLVNRAPYITMVDYKTPKTG